MTKEDIEEVIILGKLSNKPVELKIEDFDGTSIYKYLLPNKPGLWYWDGERFYDSMYVLVLEDNYAVLDTTHTDSYQKILPILKCTVTELPGPD